MFSDYFLFLTERKDRGIPEGVKYHKNGILVPESGGWEKKRTSGKEVLVVAEA